MDPFSWISGFQYAVAFTGSFRYTTYPTAISTTNKSDQKHETKSSKENQNTETTSTSTRRKDDSKVQYEMVQNKIYQDRIKELKKKHETEEQQLLERLKEVERENEKLRKQNKQLEARSMKITSAMSRLTGANGNFENVNDELNNSRLSQRFESLYSNKWVLLAGWLSKAFRAMSELERISILTNLMKQGYDECKTSAEWQINMLWQVEKKDDIPANEDFSDFLQLRRQYAVKRYVRDNIKQAISAKILQTDGARRLCSGEKEANTRKKIQTFLDEYIDCCWLMSVSNPPMVADFDVVGRLYSECKDHFKVYSSKKPIEDMTKVVGTICEVVWPCVKLEDGSAIYMKGDVVIVKKGLEAKDTV